MIASLSSFYNCFAGFAHSKLIIVFARLYLQAKIQLKITVKSYSVKQSNIHLVTKHQIHKQD